MSTSINPYAAPSDVHASSVIGAKADAIRRFWGRSIIAGLLAAATFGTALLLYWLASIGAIDLGAFGVLALGSLVSATLLLLAAARLYSLGSRRYAVGLIILGLFAFSPIIFIVMYETGVLAPLL